MTTKQVAFRFTAMVATGVLLATPPWPQAAAQTPPGPGAGGPAAGGQPAGDPPARVGRVAAMHGTVSYHEAGQTEWQAATLNYPVTSGAAFWTEPQAGAAIEVEANAMTMDQSTELDIDSLDTTTLQATEPQGDLFLSFTDVPEGETYVFRTPRGAVTITASGRYGVAAGDTEHPTTVTVLEGAAKVNVSGRDVDVGTNQTATISGGDANNFQVAVTPAQPDAFLASMTQQAPPAGQPPAGQPPAQQVALPPPVRQMTGYQDLTQYGSWNETPNDGPVWYPQAAPDYVPYRSGRWAYTQPWGWTWVDEAPWGFAPFHYGRWVEVDNRWGWAPITPGIPVYAPPVYAPALVDFFAIGAAGLAVGIAAGLAVGSIGWAPLGWGAPFRPWFNASPTYFRNVNVNNVTNINNITVNNFNRPTPAALARTPGATIVPASAMAASRPVAQNIQHLSPTQLAAARPVAGQLPVRPNAATLGVTPSVARRLNLPPAPRGVEPATRVTQGPAVAQAPRTPNAPPTLRPPGAAAAGQHPPGALAGQQPSAAAAGQRPTQAAPGPAVPPHGQAAARPGGLPTLATPGQRPTGEAPGATAGATRPQAPATHPPAQHVPQQANRTPEPSPGTATPRPGGQTATTAPGAAGHPPTAAPARPTPPRPHPTPEQAPAANRPETPAQSNAPRSRPPSPHPAPTQPRPAPNVASPLRAAPPPHAAPPQHPPAPHPHPAEKVPPQ